MYFPALKNAIQNLEEKAFYNIALLFLAQLGYRDLAIVDGSGDGGRDVTCSREDLRIQLSVRKDWERKINEEAALARQKGKRHLIYITNRIISPETEQAFLAGGYTAKGEVEITIADLRRIATNLAQPGIIRSAYEALGMAIPMELRADPKEVAISTVLLFSPEARELHDEIVEANVRAQLLHAPNLPEDVLIQRVADKLPGENLDRAARSVVSRLRVAGRILGSGNSIRLSDSEHEITQAAEIEFLAAKKLDLKMLGDVTGLGDEANSELLDLALELVIREKDPNGTALLRNR